MVKQINPGAITIAEIWQKKDTWPQGKHFDTQMNYPFAIPVLDWMTGKSGMSSGDLGTALRMAFEGLSEHGTLIAQNLFASHDTDRYVSMLHNPGREYDKNNSAMNASPGYRSERPPAATYDLAVMGVAIQAAYVGAPMVYNGDELGMWGADDPDCRKPMPWPDLQMEPEKTDPRGRPRAADDANVDKELHAFYRDAVALHVANPAFKSSDFAVLAADDEKNVVVYSRGAGAEARVVALNRSGAPQTIQFVSPAKEVIFDTSEGKDVKVSRSGDKVELLLPPLTGVVLK